MCFARALMPALGLSYSRLLYLYILYAGRCLESRAANDSSATFGGRSFRVQSPSTVTGLSCSKCLIAKGVHYCRGGGGGGGLSMAPIWAASLAAVLLGGVRNHFISQTPCCNCSLRESKSNNNTW